MNSLATKRCTPELLICMLTNEDAWILCPDGTYTKIFCSKRSGRDQVLALRKAKKITAHEAFDLLQQIGASKLPGGTLPSDDFGEWVVLNLGPMHKMPRGSFDF